MPCAPTDCADLPLPSLQRVAIHTTGAVAAAVDCHGGVYSFDLLRHTHARVWREGPFGGALCFARATELLVSVQNKVRVIDIRTRQHVTSLLGHKDDVSLAAAAEQWAITFSRDRLLLWQISDWTLARRVDVGIDGLSTLVAANLGHLGQQVGALYRDQGQLTWSLWNLDILEFSNGILPLAAEGRVPRLDGNPVLCLSQLACGDGFVSLVARKKKSKENTYRWYKIQTWLSAQTNNYIQRIHAKNT